MATRIEGLEKVHRKLEDLPNKLERKIIRKGLREGAKLWKAAAIEEAPEKSGLLKSKIKVRSAGSKTRSTSVSVGVDNKDFTGEAFYAAFLLFGHRVGKRALGDNRKLVPANNFLKRAFDSAKDSVVDKTKETWKELIEEAAKE